MRYFVTIAGRTREVELAEDGVLLDGERLEAELVQVPGSRLHHLLLEGRSFPLVARSTTRGAWELHLRGERLEAEAIDERRKAILEMTGSVAGPRGPRPVRAPMPGLVVRVEVEVGQQVAGGQGVVIIEAMKMENELKAESPGTVEAIRVAAGQPVDKGDVLVEFAAEEE